MIGCFCPRCISTDSRDKRLRASAYIQAKQGEKTTSILIDIGPDFRTQALAYGITAVDAVLLTHSHADHLHGLDDIRIFSHSYPKSREPKTADSREGLPVYGSRQTLKDIRKRFSYIFTPTHEGGGKPKLSFRPCEDFTPSHPKVIGPFEVVSIPMKHGSMDVTGWVITTGAKDFRASIAYLTDCNFISDESILRIHGAMRGSGGEGGRLTHVVIDALRMRPHSTHLNFDQALDYTARIRGEHTWFTHIAHEETHYEITAYLAERQSDLRVLPAYDGLRLATGE
jgi:phosphoribosyl 1,2-cyclic phosphate phosphodiesterase